MPVDFLVSQSLSTATSTRKAIESLTPPNIPPSTLIPGTSPVNVNSPSRTDLPTAIRSPQSSLAPADVSIARARQMIADSLAVAHKVLDALDTLSSFLNSNAFTSITNSPSAIAPGGTRISGVTIEAAASRITSAIDSLIAGLGQNSLNLISSSSRPIRVQTTEFGGRITVTPQPLDSAGLNIRDLAAVDRFEAKEAKGRVDLARYTVTSSIQNLEALERSLSLGTASGRNLSAISAAGDGISSRGALIDLIT